MNLLLPTKQKGIINLVKWLVAIGALIFLYFEIRNKAGAFELFANFDIVLGKHWKLLVLVVLLVPLNWYIESMKWAHLYRKYGELGAWNAFKGVLMGVALGLFTPNGIGEYAGRMWAVKRSQREEVVAASIAGSMSQLAITITIGGACIVYFISDYLTAKNILIGQIVAIVTIIVGVITYYKLPVLAHKIIIRVPVLNRFMKFRHALESFTRGELTRAYVLSFFRYLVFSTQLGLLLFVIGDVDFTLYWSSLFLIPVYYYIQSFIPTIALGEIGVRGMILVYLFGELIGSPEIILVSFIIWVLNLIMPGLIGLFYLIRTKMV